MERREFIKVTTATGLMTLITPGGIMQSFSREPGSSLEDSFINPPAAAKPQTWWHWMNGNVTKQGITLDLEAMKNVGIGGFQNFDAGTGIPEGPVKYLSPEWLDLKEHAIKEAERLGLEFTMHNCPGWSSSGGPWITPEISMQQMTWSEATVEGGKKISLALQRPFSQLNFYRDVVVLAFPALAGEHRSLSELVHAVSTSAGPVDTKKINGEDLQGLTIEQPAKGESGWLLFEFTEPFEARSLTMLTAGKGGGFGPADFHLASSDDGKTFTKITDIQGGGGGFGGGADALATANFPGVKAKYFKIVSSTSRHLSNVNLSGAARLENWLTKANFLGSLEFIGQPQPPGVTGGVGIDPYKILDLTDSLGTGDLLTWEAPAGAWTILRIGYTTLGTLNRSAPSTGVGLECDKYSREALDMHFNKMFAELLPTLKSTAKKGTVGLLIDSYEVGTQNWTPKLRAEFQSRKGYDLLPYLPAMTGRIVGNTDITNRFLWDLRRTQADLMADNYYGRLHELCKQHGMVLYTQPYDRGPFEEIQIGSRVDGNMGEFWAGLSQLFPNNDTMRRTIKLSASIAHTNGQKIVPAESFTAEPSSGKWQQYPYSTKALGDYMYTQGMNRLTFHRFAHQPHPTAIPGMTMGPWGIHFDRTNTWFSKASAWLKYTARCQSLLQQGLFVADIAYFTSEDVPGFTAVRPHELDPAPPEGYDYDLINAETILKRVTIKNQRITLPDSMSYRLLVLPPGRTMTLELLRKLSALVNAGMILVGNKPLASAGLSGYKDNDAAFQKLSHEMWGSEQTNLKTGRAFGKGRIFTGLPLSEILETLQVKPDFTFSALTPDAPINYIHRSVGDTEVYFIANRRRSAEKIVASFRVKNKSPEYWNPDTGEKIPIQLFHRQNELIHIPLSLDPSGSAFIIFRAANGSRNNIKSIAHNGQQVLASAQSRVPAVKFSVINNFSITLWVKPEIDIALGRTQLRSYAGRITTEYFAIHPPAGEKLYGKGHATTGLTIGRNGIVLWEREGIDAVDVLVAEIPVSGWTHIGIIYKDGAPSLYVNGLQVKEEKASGKLMHPGLDAAYQNDGAMYYNGELTSLEFHPTVVGLELLQQQVAAGVPAVKQSAPVDPMISKHGLAFFQEGSYALEDTNGKATTLKIAGLAKPIELAGPWKVSFPPALGAPEQIILEKLSSLHRHPMEGVKFFSGTATYSLAIDLPGSLFGPGKRQYLNLGRVEVLAEIEINEKQIGTLWKPPFQLDISEFVKPGSNQFTIAVTNLWPNRLIGDEKLPAEEKYVAGINAGVFSMLSNGAIQKLPDWFAEGKPKPPGGRVTFATWKHYHSESPLLESGLIGPVTITPAVIKQLPNLR